MSISPLTDYLPVEVNFWDIVKNIFNTQEETTNVFYKVVPSESKTNYFFIVTSISGLLLVILGKLWKKNKL